MEVQSFFHDLCTVAAIDSLSDFSAAEVATLRRELGDDWRDQLITPLTQPMTLRSGKVLQHISGGAKRRKHARTSGGENGICGVVSRYFARVLLLALLTMFLMAAVVPQIDPALVQANQAWTAAKLFGNNALSLMEQCPIGFGVPRWQDMVCRVYGRVLTALDTQMGATLAGMTYALKTAAGVGRQGFMAIYAFVKAFARGAGALYTTIEDVFCAFIATPYYISAATVSAVGTVAANVRALQSQAQAPPKITLEFTPEQAAMLQKLLVEMAKEYPKQQGGKKGRRRNRTGNGK